MLLPLFQRELIFCSVVKKPIRTKIRKVEELRKRKSREFGDYRNSEIMLTITQKRNNSNPRNQRPPSPRTLPPSPYMPFYHAADHRATDIEPKIC